MTDPGCRLGNATADGMALRARRVRLAAADLGQGDGKNLGAALVGDDDQVFIDSARRWLVMSWARPMASSRALLASASKMPSMSRTRFCEPPSIMLKK